MPLLAATLSASLLAATPPAPADDEDRAKTLTGFAGISGALGVALIFVETHLAIRPLDCELICVSGVGLVAIPTAHFVTLPYVLSPLAGLQWARAHTRRGRGDPQRTLGLGAGLLAGGIATAASSAILYTHPATVRHDGLVWGGTSLVALGAVMTWVGAGLLSHGATLRRHQRRMLPTAMATGTGFSIGLSGRF
jgi:hypothetical protein